MRQILFKSDVGELVTASEGVAMELVNCDVEKKEISLRLIMDDT